MAAEGMQSHDQSCGNCPTASHPASKKGRINAPILPKPARCAKSDRLLAIGMGCASDRCWIFLTKPTRRPCSSDTPASHRSNLASGIVNSYAPSAPDRRCTRNPRDPTIDAPHSYESEGPIDVRRLGRPVRQHLHPLLGHASLGARTEQEAAEQREHLDILLPWRA